MAEVAVQEDRARPRGLLTGRQRRRLKESVLGYLYLSPATAILLLFHLLPVLSALYISLHKWKILQGEYLGLENYQSVLDSTAFWQSFFLPYITSTVASSAVWVWIFNPKHGPLNQILEAIGIAPQQWMLQPRGVFQLLGRAVGIDVPKWAAGPSQALVAIMVFVIWFYVGWDTVIFLAGLGSIPPELYDAAKIDGAGRFGLFRHITLPLLSPTIFFLGTMALIGSFQAFNHIFVMTRAAGGQLGGPLRTTTTTSILMFDFFYSRVRFGYASAIAFLLFVVILVLTVLQQRFSRERVFYQ